MTRLGVPFRESFIDNAVRASSAKSATTEVLAHPIRSTSSGGNEVRQYVMLETAIRLSAIEPVVYIKVQAT